MQCCSKRNFEFEWTDYQAEDAQVVDNWLDADAVAMTGLDQGWDAYWNAVLADAVNYPGCKDFCKLINKNGVPMAAVCFGCYDGIAMVSEIVVATEHRGRGIGSRILRELVCHADKLLGEKVDKICAVVFPANAASQRAFEKAGFTFDGTHEDAAAWNYVYKMA